MTSKSEKFRELLAKERCLQSQLSDCETAQSRMLKKAFKNLGLKLGNFGVPFEQAVAVSLDEVCVDGHFSPTIILPHYSIAISVYCTFC